MKLLAQNYIIVLYRQSFRQYGCKPEVVQWLSEGRHTPPLQKLRRRGFCMPVRR